MLPAANFFSPTVTQRTLTLAAFCCFRTSSKVEGPAVKCSKSLVTQQWLSVCSLLLQLVAVSVGLSVEPREAAVRALLNTVAIMGNVKGVIFCGVSVGVPWVAQLADF